MTLTEKLSAIQQTMKAPKNLHNSFGGYNYRNAEGILEAFKPFEREYSVSLTISDSIEIVGDRIYVKATTTLIDCESEAKIETSAFAREAQTKKGMDESQITGTASSYARKYALNGLLLLDDTKDPDTDEYYQRTRKDEKAKKTEVPEKATAAQIKTIESLCNKHEIDLNKWLANNHVSKDNLTAEDAGKILQTLKTKYGDN